MLKIFLFSILLTNISFSKAETLKKRQKIIFSLTKDLFIKNILLIKHSPKIDVDTISFTKSLSKSNIYFSSPSIENFNLFINFNVYSKAKLSKTLILAFNEEFNKIIYELTSEDELAQSKFLWLVWKDKNRTVLQNNGFYIPYNSQLLIVEDGTKENEENISISEIYHPRINSPTMFKRHFGIWSENHGLEIPEKDLYKRRFNMERTDIKILYNKDTFNQPWKDFIGIVVDAMNFWDIPIAINHSFTFEEIEQKNSDWEIYLHPYVFDHTFEKHSNILGLTWKIQYHMYIRYDELLEEHAITPYILPFSKGLRTALLITIAFIGIWTFLIVYATKRNKSPFEFGYLSCFFHPIEAFLNQDGSEIPNGIYLRITIATTRLIALYIVPAYSAFLLTFILYQNIQLPFKDMEGLVKDGSYKIGFPIEKEFDNWFKITEDEWSKIAYEKYLMDKLPYTTEDALEIFCRIPKTAFIMDEDIVSQIPCKYLKIPSHLMTGWFGFRLRKNCPYERIFNRIFKMFHSTGILDRYEKQYLLLQLRYEKFHEGDGKQSVKIETVAPIMLMILILYTFAIMALALEYLFKKLSNILNSF